MTEPVKKPSRLLDLFESKAVLIFVVSSVWMVKGWYDKLEYHDQFIKQAQPIMQNLVLASESLKNTTENLNGRVAALERKVQP